MDIERQIIEMILHDRRRRWHSKERAKKETTEVHRKERGRKKAKAKTIGRASRVGDTGTWQRIVGKRQGERDQDGQSPLRTRCNHTGVVRR